MQDVDEPAVLQNFSATLMEDSVGCVQVPFFGFFAFSRYTEEKMVDCCMIFFRGFLFLLLQNGLKNGSLEICVLSVPENLCFESLLGTLDHEDCFTSFFFTTEKDYNVYFSLHSPRNIRTQYKNISGAPCGCTSIRKRARKAVRAGQIKTNKIRGSLRRSQVSLVQSVGFRCKYWRILLSAMKRTHQTDGGVDKRGNVLTPTVCFLCGGWWGGRGTCDVVDAEGGGN